MKRWTSPLVVPIVALGASAPLALAEPTPALAPSAAPAPPPSPAPPPAPPPAKKTFADAIPCGTCHTTTAWRQKGASSDGAPKFDHATTGFPLTGRHVNAPCVICHDATRATKRACASCHDDFHRGRLSRSCDTCHTAASWQATKPLEIHRMTRFPLTGMHVLADCSECHRRAGEHRFTGAPIDCFACHEKEYRRPTLRPSHVGSATTAPYSRDCSQCHRAIAWAPAALAGPLAAAVASPLRTAPPNHDVRFPISFGVHRMATCDDCHGSPSTPRAVRCVGCHAHDPVRLAQQHKQPTATDGASCLTCHFGGARR